MSPKYSWIFLVLLSLGSTIYSQSCKWLHRQQGHVTKQILQNFNQMLPAERTHEVCLENITELADIDSLYDISQVESAAIAVCEVSKQTVQFYRKHQEKLGCQQPACDRLQDLLYYQANQLVDCIPATAENHLFVEGISQQFYTLEKIIHDQGNTECVQRIINTEIRRNLQLAAQLSSRMRRRHLMKTLLWLHDPIYQQSKCSLENCKKRFNDVKQGLKTKLAKELQESHRIGGGQAGQIHYTTFEEVLKQVIPPEILPDNHIEDMDHPSSQAQLAIGKYS
ncbi:uncharacterized protein LOC135057237 [Pseudophryne corroboree]|uniref:uncharacterized protein LOC135057237 n=1 Tax=Pseudophryne corroboree TaxID=495146 RepID=UPI003081791A